MIRHRPAGSGHPYSVDTEQRDPVIPIAGEPLRLGVRATADVTEVAVEYSVDGIAGRAMLSRVPRNERGRALDGGHLASAQARLARAAGGWAAELTDLPVGAQLRYRFLSDGGRTRWFETRVAGWSAGADVDGAIPGTTTVLGDGERIWRVRCALPLAPGEHVAGFGERFDALDFRGAQLDSVVFEQYKSQGAERKTYLPMPFAHVVGGRGWGFHVRTARRVWFDVGATEAEHLWVEAETGPDGQIDVGIFEGSPAEVLDQFLAEAGRPEVLPDWVFRLWASSNEWNTQAEVMRQADAHRDHGIPVGTIVIEAWSDESTFTAWRGAEYEPTDRPHRLADFRFPADGPWPDPAGMIEELHDRDVRLVLWQIPLIKMRPHPRGQVALDAAAAVRENVLIREPGPDGRLRPYRNRGWWFPLGLMPDLTDARAAQWWTERRRYLVEELGVDGFKTDGGEHAWGDELVYLDGRLGDEGNNRYPAAYAAAYGDLLRSVGKAPVTFSRAGYTGSQAHGAVWAGDENSTWEAFRWSLYAGLSASASGILYWGWDVAGFSGDVPTPELYVRSMAAATFVPIMQYHSEYNHHRRPLRDRTPWNIGERWDDPTVVPAVREWVLLRERLIPYLAEQTRLAIAAGTTLMRPLYFDHPTDERVWERPLQWMLGDDLLVAPVTEEGAATWEVYLPRGAWIDVWTGEELEGGRIVTREVPLEITPVYCRRATWPAMRAVFTP